MSYSEVKAHLKGVFNQYQFDKAVEEKKFNQYEVELERCKESIISVSFPGYKSIKKKNGMVCDYRIDLTKKGNKTTLSHANIIVDIYQKVKLGGGSVDVLQETMIDTAKNGVNDVSAINEKLPVNSYITDDLLLKRIEKEHQFLNKQFNTPGNRMPLTWEELFLSLKWIVVQEDINYPIAKGFQGRKMCFKRYLEAIYVATATKYSLEEVIKRTLSHQRPEDWNEVDYSELEKLV